MTGIPPRRARLTLQARITLLYFLGALPVAVLAMALLWAGNYDSTTRWTLTLLTLAIWIGCALSLREKIVRPLQTLANLLEALREEDFSLRARRVLPTDVLGEVIHEVNSLGELLRRKRLSEREATTLLRAVMSEIDVGIFTFDDAHRLRLVNRAGARLMAQTVDHLLGQTAESLGLAEFLDATAAATLQRTFPGASGRWSLRSRTFHEHGVPHRLLVITDLTRELREEELLAWKRIVRVLGHEINNSLAPIKSIAGSMQSLLNTRSFEECREDALRGLSVIEGRAAALNRFLESYAMLAKLPPPKSQPVNVAGWVRRAAALEHRLAVHIEPGEPLEIPGDGDQLDQLLINLIRNAAEAALETAGTVEVFWRHDRGLLRLTVRDDGPGIANPANLFVPFFTTKPGGSGIGLLLSRQIAEAHGGSLELRNRAGRPGCEALVCLPGAKPVTV